MLVGAKHACPTCAMRSVSYPLRFVFAALYMICMWPKLPHKPCERTAFRPRALHTAPIAMARMLPLCTRMPFCIILCLALSRGKCSNGITLSYPVSLCGGVTTNRLVLSRSRPCPIAQPSSRVKFIVTRAVHANFHGGAHVMLCDSALFTLSCRRTVKRWRRPTCARCTE